MIWVLFSWVFDGLYLLCFRCVFDRILFECVYCFLIFVDCWFGVSDCCGFLCFKFICDLFCVVSRLAMGLVE